MLVDTIARAPGPNAARWKCLKSIIRRVHLTLHSMFFYDALYVYLAV